jgi:hypothetical protein
LNTDDDRHKTNDADEQDKPDDVRHETNEVDEHHEEPNGQPEELDKEATGSESAGSKRARRPTIPQPTTVSHL